MTALEQQFLRSLRAEGVVPRLVETVIDNIASRETENMRWLHNAAKRLDEINRQERGE